MDKMSSVKKICICAICIALCYVLPIAFHTFGIGNAFSPMHIPVLLCGMVCGSFYGGFCGVAGPLLSSLLSGMPPATALVTMLPELLTYGIVTGFMMKRIHTGKLVTDLYVSLGIAMVVGRIVAGIARALFVTLVATGDTFGISLWISSYFVGSLPGIVVHLVLLPILVTTLMKAGIIPRRYGNAT